MKFGGMEKLVTSRGVVSNLVVVVLKELVQLLRLSDLEVMYGKAKFV
jgi:hypothetical protein